MARKNKYLYTVAISDAAVDVDIVDEIARINASIEYIIDAESKDVLTSMVNLRFPNTRDNWKAVSSLIGRSLYSKSDGPEYGRPGIQVRRIERRSDTLAAVMTPNGLIPLAKLANQDLPEWSWSGFTVNAGSEDDAKREMRVLLSSLDDVSRLMEFLQDNQPVERSSDDGFDVDEVDLTPPVKRLEAAGFPIDETDPSYWENRAKKEEWRASVAKNDAMREQYRKRAQEFRARAAEMRKRLASKS